MLKFSSHATATVCAVGLAIAAIKPSLQIPAAAPVASELAFTEVQPGEPGELIGELPVSVVTSNFDLAATDASQFGDLD